MEINVQEIKQRVNLLDLISPDTTLRGGPIEYSGPCPRCEGTDRFHLHIDKGWFCRVCTGEPDGVTGHWHDELDYIQWRDGVDFIEAYQRLGGDTRATAEESARLLAERTARDQERREQEARRHEERRKALDQSQAWLDYYRSMPEEGRALWHERGLSDLWIDYFQVGYNPGREFWHEGEKFTAKSLTIPTLRPHLDNSREPSITWDCVGLTHRLLMSNPPGGKYRPHTAGLGKSLFRCDLYDEKIRGEVLLVEGEIKAMVTWAYIQDWISPHYRSLLHRISVVGIAGKSFKPEWLEEFKEATKIYVCLDPDASTSAEKLARILGIERCKVIDLPDKIDDMLIAGTLKIEKLRELVDTARRVDDV